MLLAVLLNPSSNDYDGKSQASLDPLVWHALSNKFGGIEVVNAFSLVDVDSRALSASSDRVRPSNDEHIRAAFTHAGQVIVAWGSRMKQTDLRPRLKELRDLLDGNVWCLGINLDGQPKHPLSSGWAKQLYNW
jgi:hypothetical protein